MERSTVESGTDLALARTCYGRGTAPWSAGGRLEVEDDWWLALSHTPYVDYNLSLLHGPSSGEAVSHVLDAIGRARRPALVMLAGAGLGAADALGEAGWVCTGTQPFMARTAGPAVEDPAARPLRTEELAEARVLAGSAFGVPEEVSAIVYSEEALDRPDTRAWGLFEDGILRCCSLAVWVDGLFNVGWALATAPEHQRSGYGRRLLRASNFYRLHRGGPPVALCTASPAGERLYHEEGYITLEYWQSWSRARWVLR
jgi:GNAT superfamily N-acetyltransferase